MANNQETNSPAKWRNRGWLPQYQAWLQERERILTAAPGLISEDDQAAHEQAGLELADLLGSAFMALDDTYKAAEEAVKAVRAAMSDVIGSMPEPHWGIPGVINAVISKPRAGRVTYNTSGLDDLIARLKQAGKAEIAFQIEQYRKEGDSAAGSLVVTRGGSKKTDEQISVEKERDHLRMVGRALRYTEAADQVAAAEVLANSQPVNADDLPF